MGDYHALDAWRAAHELALSVYRATAAWPAGERYGLTAQVRRAVFSIPANIAEGSRRRGPREFRHFMDIAIGSLGEVEYALEFAVDSGLVGGEDLQGIRTLLGKTGRLCFRLARSLEPASRST